MSEKNGMKKVLVYLEKSTIRGGIEIYAERDVARMRSEGMDVELLEVERGKLDAAFDFGRYGEIVVHKCGDVQTLERFPADKTTYFVHDHEPICPRTHAYTPLMRNCTRAGGFWPCIICAAACRHPLVAAERALTQGRRLAAMRRFRRIAVISQFMKGRLMANGISEDKIFLAPAMPGGGAGGAAASIAAAVPTAARDIDMLYAGQLIRGKGVHLLLKAMAMMKSGRTLDIIGTGNMEKQLKKLTSRLGLGGRVRFHGFQPDAVSWMRRARTTVVPSFWQEPFGLVGIEARKAGSRVVAFATGGLKESCAGEGTRFVESGNIAALAKALDEDGAALAALAAAGRVDVYVFVDALGWEQAQKYDFLREELPYRKKIEMQFGYSSTAVPTILTGLRPEAHGHLAFYDYAPAASPFKAMKYVAPLLRPKGFWRRGRVRNVLSRLVKRFYGFTGYFQLYGVPLERLGSLDYCEKRDMFVRGGMWPHKNLADVWTEQGMRWHISDWRKSEDENFSIARELIERGELDRAFVYSAAFDALEHDNPGRDEVLRPKVAAYAGRIKALHAALEASGRPFTLTVFSDHGMTPLRGTADAPKALAATGLEWGKDYASAIDSTMARFWWLRDGAKESVEKAFAPFPGHWLTVEEMKKNGIWREDAKFGNAIFLLDPGVQFCPGDMGVKPLNGMHGYDPTDKDSAAAWLSTRPVPESVARVCDYFAVMTEK